MACSLGVWAQETVPVPPTVAEAAAPATPPPVSNTVEKPPAAPEAIERSTLQNLIQRAESGETNAQFQLAHRYLNGEGVATDNFMALQWFTRAAEQGNSNAQYNIAVMYLNGIGVIQDNTAAVDWFQKAANNGDAQAQFTLAIILFNGQYGMTKNVPQAYKWFTLAGSAGIREAAANAVLIQEMMPPGQVGQMQQEALDWIENYQSRQTHPEQ
jgi:TPR repeat protein